MKYILLILSISFFSCAQIKHEVVNADAEKRAKQFSAEKKKEREAKKKKDDILLKILILGSIL